MPRNSRSDLDSFGCFVVLACLVGAGVMIGGAFMLLFRLIGALFGFIF